MGFATSGLQPLIGAGASGKPGVVHRARRTRAVRAAAQRGHDTADAIGADPAAVCPRWPMIRDRPAHRRRRWRTPFQRMAFGGLSGGALRLSSTRRSGPARLSAVLIEVQVADQVADRVTSGSVVSSGRDELAR